MTAQMACMLNDAECDMCMHSWIEIEFIHPPYLFAFIVLLGCFPTITPVRSVARNFPFKPFAIAVGWVQHSAAQPLGIKGKWEGFVGSHFLEAVDLFWIGGTLRVICIS